MAKEYESHLDLNASECCQVKRSGRGGMCRGETGLIYLGRGICEKHWSELGDDPKKLRKKLGVKLNAK